MATTLSWVDECTCCCGDEQVHVEYDTNKMKCATCGCYKNRPKDGPEKTPISVRLVVRGNISLKVMDQASVLARALGADDEVVLRKASSAEHYIDVPADGMLSRLEIQNITKQTAAKTAAK